ncbi:MAG: flagellar hook-basal body complex protein FliE [Planctomycetales bacterium]|nr:flagellar hook-basal body complex protein FliE [Planctomycetales bacterium]
MSVNPISSPLTLRPPTAPTLAAGGATGQTPSFQDLLLDSIREVNGMQQDAQHAVETLATGGDANLAEVMTAVQKADMSFRLMMQMRNKLVQAYQEIKDIRI